MTRADIVKATGRDLSEMSRMIEKLVDREYAGCSSMGDQCARTMKLFQLGAVCPLLYLWEALLSLRGQAHHIVHEIGASGDPDHALGCVVVHASSRSA